MIDPTQLPIPDWGLVCPKCSYPLQGLPAHRCPECGHRLNMAALVQPWTRLRDPRFAGRERPLPDFGLTCPACRQPLAGATGSTCPHCGVAFDVQSRQPAGEWFIVDAFLCDPVPVAGVQALLVAEQVPHMEIADDALRQIYGVRSIIVSRLRVPTEFYFEVLWLVQKARVELLAARAADGAGTWHCPQCHEENPANFELCWSCQQPRP